MTTNNNNQPRPLLTMEDLADVLNVPLGTLYKWSRRGQPDFPRHHRLPNKQIRVSESDLDKWLKGKAA